MMKRFFVAMTMLCFSLSVFAQVKKTAPADQTIVFNQDFADGEALFQLNKPAEAIPLFEKIIDDKNIDPTVFIYLGVAYYQVGAYQKSLDVCVKGLTRAGTNHKVLAYNAGNSAYALGNYARADACYAIAIKEDDDFSVAYLNRANAQLKLDHLEDARENYQAFITKEPENEQRPSIEQLIALLDAEIVRRANEKPELITPESLNIGNEAMQMPDDAEKIVLDDFQADELAAAGVPANQEENTLGEERLVAADFVAPALPPEELSIVTPAEPEGEEVEIPVLPDANPVPPEEPRVLERVAADEIPSDDAK